MKHLSWSLIASTLLLVGAADAAPVAVGTYDFRGGSLAAAETGAPALVAIDPVNANGFMSDTVFGTSKTV